MSHTPLRLGTATQYQADGLHIYGIHATQGPRILVHHEGFWDWDGKYHRAQPNAPTWETSAEMAVIYTGGPNKPCKKKVFTQRSVRKGSPSSLISTSALLSARQTPPSRSA